MIVRGQTEQRAPLPGNAELQLRLCVFVFGLMPSVPRDEDWAQISFADAWT